MIGRDAFFQEFSALSAFLERRRRRYLRFFYTAIFLALLLVASAVCIPGQAMHFLCRLFFFTRPVNASDILAYRLFVSFLSLLLIVRPVHFYRTMRFTALVQAGQSTDYSLKDACYARMFALFGPYEFTPHGSIPIASIRQSLLCGQHLRYSGRDCVSGSSHAVGVKICDVTITHPVGEKALPRFHGLLFVFDISQMQVKLRVPFKGKVLLAASALCDALATPPLKKLPLPGALGSEFSLYSSNIAETQRVIRPPLPATLAAFAKIAAESKALARHCDDRAVAIAQAVREYVKEKVVSALGKAELAAEKAYDRLYEEVAGTTGAAQEQAALEYYDDKCIVFISCARGLMESKSLFEPVMSQESAEFLYAVMEFTDTITLHLNTVMP
jgi:hypothetical protein